MGGAISQDEIFNGEQENKLALIVEFHNAVTALRETIRYWNFKLVNSNHEPCI